MPLVTAQDFPRIFDQENNIGLALGIQRLIGGAGIGAGEHKRAEEYKAELALHNVVAERSEQFKRIRALTDSAKTPEERVRANQVQRKQIVELALAADERGENTDIYEEALYFQNGDEFNHYLSQIITRTDGFLEEKADSKVLARGAMLVDSVGNELASNQSSGFETIRDDSGNVIGQRDLDTGEVKTHPGASKLLTPAEIEQKLELYQARAEMEAAAQANTPMGQAGLEAQRLRVEKLQEEIAASEQVRELKTEKQKRAQAKAKLSFDKTTGELGEFRRLALEIANDPDLAAVTGLIDNWIVLPGSKNADIRAKLKRLEALSAFASLSEMREASPTGGALGNVSEKELVLLANQKAAIQTTQSAPQLQSSLLRLADDLAGSEQRLTDAFNTDFGAAPSLLSKDPKTMTDQELQQALDELRRQGKI